MLCGVAAVPARKCLSKAAFAASAVLARGSPRCQGARAERCPHSVCRCPCPCSFHSGCSPLTSAGPDAAPRSGRSPGWTGGEERIVSTQGATVRDGADAAAAERRPCTASNPGSSELLQAEAGRYPAEQPPQNLRAYNATVDNCTEEVDFVEEEDLTGEFLEQLEAELGGGRASGQEGMFERDEGGSLKLPLSRRLQFMAISPKPATMRYIDEFGLAKPHQIGSGRKRGKYDAKMKHNQREKLGLNNPSQFSLLKRDPIEVKSAQPAVVLRPPCAGEWKQGLSANRMLTNVVIPFPDSFPFYTSSSVRTRRLSSLTRPSRRWPSSGGRTWASRRFLTRWSARPRLVWRRRAGRCALGARAVHRSVPGTTQSIDFYRGDARLKPNGTKPIRVIDVPGYGYAEATDDERMRWLALIKEYLTTRPNLKRIFLLLDARFGLKFADKCFLQDMGRLKAKIQVVLTKCDYVSMPVLARRHVVVVEEIKNYPDMLPDVIMVSSATGACVDILRRVILQAANITKVKTLREAREDWAPAADPRNKRNRTNTPSKASEDLKPDENVKYHAKHKLNERLASCDDEGRTSSAYRNQSDQEKFNGRRRKQQAPETATSGKHAQRSMSVDGLPRRGIDGDEGDILAGEEWNYNSSETEVFAWDDGEGRWVTGRKTTATGGWNVRRQSGYGSKLPGARRFYTSQARRASAEDAFDVLPEEASWSVKSLLPTLDLASRTCDVTPEVLDGLLRLAGLRTPGDSVRSSDSERAAAVAALSADVNALCHFVRHIQEVSAADVPPLVRLSEEWGCPLRADQWMDEGDCVGRTLIKYAKRTEGEYYVVDTAPEGREECSEQAVPVASAVVDGT